MRDDGSAFPVAGEGGLTFVAEGSIIPTMIDGSQRVTTHGRVDMADEETLQVLSSCDWQRIHDELAAAYIMFRESQTPFRLSCLKLWGEVAVRKQKDEYPKGEQA